MNLLENIYRNSPISFQNIMATIAGYKKNYSRYGRVYREYRKFLKEFDTWNFKQKVDYQRQELNKFIKFAAKNSRFYKKIYEDIELDSIKTIKDLKKLPIVEKEDVRKNIKDIITIPKHKGVEGHTGGTTGKSLVVLFTKSDMMKRSALLDHFKDRHGFKHRDMRRATFNGKHIVPRGQQEKIFWRYNAACKQMIYSSFHLSENNMKYYVDSFKKFKPHAIDGFFMSIYDLASFIDRNNIKLNFSPIAIFPTSEKVTESGRNLIEKVFGCKVFDQYASSEGAPFVTECEFQNLHMEMSSGIIEHMDEEGDEILITSFTTHGTPLIRYRIQDAMKFRKKEYSCNCGMESKMISAIKGRKLDFLYTNEGAKINAGNIANLFKNIPNALVRAQVIQEEVGKVIIKLEVDQTRYKKEFDDLIIEEFKDKFGNTTEVYLNHVDRIERESSGKFQMVKNKV